MWSIPVVKIRTDVSAELTVWTQCITEKEFLRLDTKIENFISVNHFFFSETKNMKVFTKYIFGITITFGDWATKMISMTKTISALRKNPTVRKIMTYNRNPSMSIDINSALFTLRIQYE